MQNKIHLFTMYPIGYWDLALLSCRFKALLPNVSDAVRYVCLSDNPEENYLVIDPNDTDNILGFENKDGSRTFFANVEPPELNALLIFPVIVEKGSVMHQAFKFAKKQKAIPAFFRICEAIAFIGHLAEFRVTSVNASSFQATGNLETFHTAIPYDATNYVNHLLSYYDQYIYDCTDEEIEDVKKLFAQILERLPSAEVNDAFVQTLLAPGACIYHTIAKLPYARTPSYN